MSHNRRNTAFLAVVALAAAGTLIAQAAAADTGKARPDTAKAAPDTTPKITFDGYVDGYYAWDFDRPNNFDRAYTTQPARHAEFNINLAFVDVRIAGPRYRGRIAVQYGTSVQSNY